MKPITLGLLLLATSAQASPVEFIVRGTVVETSTGTLPFHTGDPFSLHTIVYDFDLERVPGIGEYGTTFTLTLQHEAIEFTTMRGGSFMTYYSPEFPGPTYCCRLVLQRMNAAPRLIAYGNDEFDWFAVELVGPVGSEAPVIPTSLAGTIGFTGQQSYMLSVDDIRPIPEPATLVLFGSGLLMLRRVIRRA